MNRQWILVFPTAIPFLILGTVVALRISGARKLKRMRQLTCPDCHTSFTVPSLATVRQWMDFDVETGRQTQSGFALHCDRCSADYRFTDGFQLVGRAEQKSSA